MKTIKHSDNIFTLHNGVKLESFKENGKREEIRNKYNIKSDDFVFMYCGRLTPDKGAYEMAKAFSMIDNKNMPAHKMGRQWKFKIDEVDNWIKSGASAD